MAEDSFYLEIMTSEKIIFKGKVEYLRLPGREGEMGILKNHAPLIALLQPGECQIRYNKNDILMALGDGFVKINDNKVLVIVSFALNPGEIDTEEQRQIIKEEEGYFKEMKGEGLEFEMHRMRLLRAKACLRVAKEQIK